MVWGAMGGKWTFDRIQFSRFTILILVFLEIHGCLSLNSEGLALLQFHAKVDFDPSGALENWNPIERDPCMWFGVHCMDGEVHMLDLNGLDLEGVLAPELGNLPHLRFLDLARNQFSGNIPRQFGQLRTLQLLNWRSNNLSGIVPEELGQLRSLKCLLLYDNRFEGSIPAKLNFITDLRFDDNLKPVADGAGCINRKFGDCLWQRVLKPSKKSDSFQLAIKRTVIRYLNQLPMFKFGSKAHNHDHDSWSDQTSVDQDVENHAKNFRRVLTEQSSNFAAAPPNAWVPLSPGPTFDIPSRSSGSFPAVPNKKKPFHAPVPSPSSETNRNDHHSSLHKLLVGILSVVFFLIFVAAVVFMCSKRAVRTIRPWKTGLSGQLQRAFVTGVPKLNRSELETACEDFSNIIITYDGVATVYKGTLSTGVEIVVASTAITSSNDWSKRSELAFRKKIDTLSRVNHKNFVSLLGYCEEDEPFTRMMVFEYAPNGTLFEHLHVQEAEHLDWNTRMRVMMGIVYCLQYKHDLNPPVPHFNLTSKEILLTDDYAAKIADISFWADFVAQPNNPSENETEHSERQPVADVKTNVYSFGLLLLELISGKIPHSEEQGSLVKWAAQYLNDKRTLSYMIDPTLKSFKDNELNIVCEVIDICLQQDPCKRPCMREVIQRLRQEIDIPPEMATPRMSPLWWAELEILSAEAP